MIRGTIGRMVVEAGFFVESAHLDSHGRWVTKGATSYLFVPAMPSVLTDALYFVKLYYPGEDLDQLKPIRFLWRTPTNEEYLIEGNCLPEVVPMRSGGGSSVTLLKIPKLALTQTGLYQLEIYCDERMIHQSAVDVSVQPKRVDSEERGLLRIVAGVAMAVGLATVAIALMAGSKNSGIYGPTAALACYLVGLVLLLIKRRRRQRPLKANGKPRYD